MDCLTLIIFSTVYYGKQGFDSFDDGYVDCSDCLLTAKLNQEAAVHISVNMYRLCI